MTSQDFTRVHPCRIDIAVIPSSVPDMYLVVLWPTYNATATSYVAYYVVDTIFRIRMSSELFHAFTKLSESAAQIRNQAVEANSIIQTAE